MNHWVKKAIMLFAKKKMHIQVQLSKVISTGELTDFTIMAHKHTQLNSYQALLL